MQEEYTIIRKALSGASLSKNEGIQLKKIIDERVSEGRLRLANRTKKQIIEVEITKRGKRGKPSVSFAFDPPLHEQFYEGQDWTSFTDAAGQLGINMIRAGHLV